MLKKTLVGVAVLSLFVGIILVHAQTKTINHYEDQYIDTLNLPWGASQHVMKETLNQFIERPESADPWDFECADSICKPFYMDGIVKHLFRTSYEFTGYDKLKSVTAKYDATGYTRLIERIEKDFGSSAVVRAYQYNHHIYEKKTKKSVLTVEITHRGINKPIKFYAKVLLLKQKEGDTTNEEIAMANTDLSVLYRAPFRAMLAYLAIRANHHDL